MPCFQTLAKFKIMQIKLEILKTMLKCRKNSKKRRKLKNCKNKKNFLSLKKPGRQKNFNKIRMAKKNSLIRKKSLINFN